MRLASGEAFTRPPDGVGWPFPPDGRDGAAVRPFGAVSAACEPAGAGGMDSGRLRSGVGWVACASGEAAALGAGALTASPGSPITATSCETGTVVPAATTCLSSVPPARATSSITALSVSTSASTSPTATGSPSCFFHSTRRPSSIVGESASMTTLVAIGYSRYRTCLTAAATLAGSTLAARSSTLLYGMGTSAPVTRRIGASRRVEGFALNGVHHLRADPRERPTLLGHDAAVGLGHRGEDRFGVQGSDRPQVYHLGLDPLAGELLRGLERDGDRLGVADDGDVRPRPLDLGLP